MAKLDKKKLLSLDEKIFQNLKQNHGDNVEEALEDLSDQCDEQTLQFIRESEYPDLFKFFYIKGESLNLKNMSKKYKSILETLKVLTNMHHHYIYIYYAEKILETNKTYDIFSLYLILSKFDYQLLEELLAYFSLEFLFQIESFTSEELDYYLNLSTIKMGFFRRIKIESPEVNASILIDKISERFDDFFIDTYKIKDQLEICKILMLNPNAPEEKDERKNLEEEKKDNDAPNRGNNLFEEYSDEEQDDDAPNRGNNLFGEDSEEEKNEDKNEDSDEEERNEENNNIIINDPRLEYIGLDCDIFTASCVKLISDPIENPTSTWSDILSILNLIRKNPYYNLTNVNGNFLNRYSYGNMRKRILIKDPFTKLALACLILNKTKETSLVSDIVTCSVILNKPLKEIISLIKRKEEIDLKKLYAEGQGVHSEGKDEFTNEIVSDFMKTMSKNVSDNEVMNILDEFFREFERQKENMSQDKYEKIVRALGYNEHKEKNEHLPQDHGPLIQNYSLEDTFLLTGKNYTNCRYSSLKFIAYLFYFALNYEDKTCSSEISEEDRERCLKKERRLAVSGIFEGLKNAYSSEFNYVVCNWGKAQHLITSVLTGRYKMSNGKEADINNMNNEDKVEEKPKKIDNFESICYELKKFYSTIEIPGTEYFFEQLFYYFSDQLINGRFFNFKSVIFAVFFLDTDSKIIMLKKGTNDKTNPEKYIIDIDKDKSYVGKNLDIDISDYVKKFYSVDCEQYYEANPEILRSKNLYEKELAERLEKNRKLREKADLMRKKQSKPKRYEEDIEDEDN